MALSLIPTRPGFASCCLVLCLAGSLPVSAQTGPGRNTAPLQVEGGQLSYTPDQKGNRIPDFSYAGYRAGEHPIPYVPVRIVVPVTPGDATARIQAALDQVASLPPGKDGIRGAVLLEKGVYRISGTLYLRSSGLVLRGSGSGEGGTVVLGEGRDRQTLVVIRGKNDRQQAAGDSITAPYVPVNATTVRVASPHGYKVGDAVLVRRPSTARWISELGAGHFGGGITPLGWKPGTRDLEWDRQVVAVDGQTITLDAPLTTALDTAYGGGQLARYQWPGRIRQVGVENLRCSSAYDPANPKDEDHRWMAVTLENVADAWVRQVEFRHFAGSAVAVLETARRVTVEDCKSLTPVSEIGGLRRYSYYTTGQQTLFQRCYAEYGYHDFAAGFGASLDAFVQCASHLPYSFSGTIDSWASGILFDIVNVEGNALRLANRSQDAQGAGWSAANSVLWQSTAALVEAERPPTANNWVFGCWGQFRGNSYWEQSNVHIRPRSLYYGQLAARLGDSTGKRAHLVPMDSEPSTSPSLAQAALLTAEAARPALPLSDWIDRAAQRNPILLEAAVPKITGAPAAVRPAAVPATEAPGLRNGWIVRGAAAVTGGRISARYWQGDLRPYYTREAALAVTRFVPGRVGNGLTDDLEEMTDSMKARHAVLLDHHYALWYDRRRDDHERVRRMDGEVWGPLYELPFARSGQGAAWDGLSKYDLAKYNPWYWNRLKQFADLADRKGLVLVHQHYFQHNIIEAGAHYADFPWRPANNINNTGFPEPVPYAGDKRIFLAEQFYDTSHPVRKALHKAYIRQCLDNFAANTGVIHMVSAEYTGPLHFVQFWLDVIAEWEKETGKHPLVALSTTKDVQDAVLADAARAALVDIIDIRYWHYQQDGAPYAPAGGKSLSPRQHARLRTPQPASPEQVYRAVSEYRQRFPGKAVMYSGDGYEQLGWAAFMAGGSLAALPAEVPRPFLEQAAQMQPLAPAGGGWTLAAREGGQIRYLASAGVVTLDLSGLGGAWVLRWLDPRTGAQAGPQEKVKGGGVIKTKNPLDSPVLAWISRK